MKNQNLPRDSSITASEAIALVFERYNAFMGLWNFYAVVAVGILTIVATKSNTLPDSKWIVFAAYIMFAGCHLPGLWATGEHWKAASDLARQILNAQNLKGSPEASIFGGVEKTSRVKFNPPPLIGVVAAHLLFDAAILFIVVKLW